MVAPFVPYAVRGVIWYQGEHNVSNPTLWENVSDDDPRLAHRLGRKGFAVQFLPVAGHEEATNDAGKPTLMRFQQAKALELPGMAVIYDTADELNNHPNNK